MTLRYLFRWAFFLFAVTLFAIKTFFIGWYVIESPGMYPGLPAGTRTFVVQRPYADPSSVKHGDVIVFLREEHGQNYEYIWRVVGLPGDTIETSGESLTINGQPVRRQRVRETDGRTIYREQIGDAAYDIAIDSKPGLSPAKASLTVPPGKFFVMGDNRFQARDSRYFGPINFSAIVGKKL